MNWSTQIQNAVDYIEMNLTEKIDIKLLAAQNFSSVYHFQRVFTIFTGYTLGQYIRFRRMTLAGADLAAGNEKVINIALKYGYENPDSFTKTFKKFHGILPSLVQEQREMLKIFPKINLDTLLESEQKMMYRIEEKKAIHITGYSSHFGGDPSERYEQQHHFMVDGETRFIRYALQGMACDCSTEYGVVYHFDNAGYEFLLELYARYFLCICLFFDRIDSKNLEKTRLHVADGCTVAGSWLASCLRHLLFPGNFCGKAVLLGWLERLRLG